MRGPSIERAVDDASWLAADSGQAMAEYAIVVAALMGGLLYMGFQIIPEFIRAFQHYHDGYYMLLSLPFP